MIGVYGTGSFATCIANIIAQKHEVFLYAHRENLVSEIINSRISSNQKINSKISVTNDVKLFTEKCNYIFLILPSDYLDQALSNIQPYFNTEKHKLVHGIKSLIFSKDLVNPVEVISISKYIEKNYPFGKVGYIGGPNLASEIAHGEPAVIVCSHYSQQEQKNIQSILTTDTIVTSCTSDVIGIEILGSLKNIYSIAIGYIQQLNLGFNTQGALFTSILDEMKTIALHLGAQQESIYGFAGIGDLLATALCKNSRNHSLGRMLAQGHTLQAIYASTNTKYEGVKTTQAIAKYCNNHAINAKITRFVSHIINNEFTSYDIQKLF